MEKIDHGPQDTAENTAAAWHVEIARRIEYLDSGKAETIPAEQAERMIRDGLS